LLHPCCCCIPAVVASLLLLHPCCCCIPAVVASLLLLGCCLCSCCRCFLLLLLFPSALKYITYYTIGLYSDVDYRNDTFLNYQTTEYRIDELDNSLEYRIRFSDYWTVSHWTSISVAHLTIGGFIKDEYCS
jgi:hypothetical protein